MAEHDDPHAVMISEFTGSEYVGECTCGLQIRSKYEPGMVRDWYLHAGFINPALKREVERQLAT